MVYLISTYIPGVINTSSFSIVLSAAFALTVGTILLIWLGEIITEKGVSNGISLLIFASIVSGMTSAFMNFTGSAQQGSLLSVLIFILAIVLVLIILSILLIRTRKEIPITYAKAGKIQETAVLPIPLNPVGMIPIIFAIAFVSFPYLLGQVIHKFNPSSHLANSIKDFTATYLNIYTNNPHWIAVLLYFVFIVLFTFFYSWVVFKPEKMAEQIQKRGGYIPGIRP
jgi:preprotein translocase subunit SecY